MFELWLRWGRFAAFRKSGRIRPSLPSWQRATEPGEHSVFAGRTHFRHGLRVPLEEHVLVVAPPRTFKTAFLADVILHYPGPVISTTTKAPKGIEVTLGQTDRGDHSPAKVSIWRMTKSMAVG